MAVTPVMHVECGRMRGRGSLAEDRSLQIDSWKALSPQAAMARKPLVTIQRCWPSDQSPIEVGLQLHQEPHHRQVPARDGAADRRAVPVDLGTPCRHGIGGFLRPPGSQGKHAGSGVGSHRKHRLGGLRSKPGVSSRPVIPATSVR